MMRLKAEERKNEEMEVLEVEDEWKSEEEMVSEYEEYTDSEEEPEPKLKPVYIRK